jgi:hypothetical protein
MKRVLGGLMVLMGLALGCWIGYNLLIERQPETRGKSPILAIGFCAGLLLVGVKWVRG